MNKYLWKKKIFISIDACDQYKNYDWLHIMQFSMLVSIIKIKVVIIKSDDNISMANDNFYNCDCKNGLYCILYSEDNDNISESIF